MALSEFQKQEADRLFSEGKSTLDVYRHLGAKASGRTSPLNRQLPPSVLNQPTPGQQRRAEFGQVIQDIPQDIITGVRQLGEGYIDRFGRMQESFKAGLRGEQTPIETGVQLGANLTGGLFVDPAFQLLKTGASLPLTQDQETAVGESISRTVQNVDEKAGISDWYNSQDPRTQRNINAALDVVDVLPVGITGRVRSMFTKTPKTPSINAELKLQEAVSRAREGDITDANRVVNATVDEATRERQVTEYARSLEESLRENRRAVTNNLKSLADEMSRGDNVVTYDQLIKNLANEGIVPDVDGRLADFTAEVRKLEERQRALFTQYEPLLANSRATASIDEFGQFARNSMASSRNLRFELDTATNRLDRLLDNLRRGYNLDETGALTAKQIDEISREANARSSAYRKDGNTFEADVYSELGRAARQWLTENIPDNSFRQVNDEWLRLENIKKTAEILDGQIIDVGVLDRALGSYMTTLAGVTITAASTNPAFAVAVGILTKMGGDRVGDLLRKRQFSPEVRDKLQQVMTSDRQLVERLKQSAKEQENKNLFDDLSRMLPPARPNAPRSEIGSGAPIVATQTGASAPRGQVVESVAEGAIRTPETGNLQPIPRALYPQMTEAELQKLNTDSFRKTLENVGLDADTVKKAFIGGTVGTLLMLYMNEDGSTLPAFGVIMGAMASRGGKLQMLDEAIRANNLRREAYMRAGKTEKSPEIKTLDKQMTSLAKEKALIEDTLSPGMTIKDVSGKAQGATPSTNLLEEAKGKSLEEFIESKTDPLYEFKQGVGINDEFIARGSVKEALDEIGGLKYVHRGIISPDKLELTENINTASDRYRQVLEEVKRGERTPVIVNDYGEVIDGHHRLKAYEQIGLTEVPVIAPKSFQITTLTRSQLEDIWKQANQ